MKLFFRRTLSPLLVVTSLPFAVALTGCANAPADGEGEGAAAAVAGAVTSTQEGDVTTTRVDARAADRWIYFDLGWSTEVFPASPETTASWDLAFNRYHVKSNGGISGVGDVAVAALPGARFDDVTAAPGEGYVADGDEQLAFAGWYTYDMASHALHPADVVYVVRSVSGEYFKIGFTSYYDAEATSGFPTFRWAPVDPPASESAR